MSASYGKSPRKRIPFKKTEGDKFSEKNTPDPTGSKPQNLGSKAFDVFKKKPSEKTFFPKQHQQNAEKKKRFTHKKDEPAFLEDKKTLPKSKFDFSPRQPKTKTEFESFGEATEIRLNKYLANSGVAARRKADELIKEGQVTVNGTVITEMGYKVKPKDVVKFQGTVVKPGRKIYLLMNKPKDFITTTEDEKGRKTVLDIVKKYTRERVYPVGRLDRNTTGLLLFTNDGDLAQKLSHPSFNVKKIYAAELDKPLKPTDLEKIRQGIALEEGIAMVDDIQYAEPNNKKIIGIEIHVGWNRIVRRIFEALGYEVLKLDRVTYAGLTKKDLPRGRCRLLTEQEVYSIKKTVK